MSDDDLSTFRMDFLGPWYSPCIYLVGGHSMAKGKSRTVSFSITYIDEKDDENSIRDMSIDVTFTGKIHPSSCMEIMADALLKELERDEGRKSLGDKLDNPLIKGHFKDLLICT